MAASDDRHRTRRLHGLLLTGALLAWLGMLICFLLLHHLTANFFCRIGSGCEVVLSSRYAAFLGIPLPWAGLGFYGTMLGLLLWSLATNLPARRTRLVNAALWLAVAATTFSGSLMWVQFGVLQAFCSLCTASAAVVTALTALTWRAAGDAEDSTAGGKSAVAATLATGAAVTSVAFLLALKSLPASSAPGPQFLQIDLTTAKTAGPPDAPVQLVVFSDFQCQFCARLAPVLKRVREEFPDDLLVAFRYFPLEQHPRAIPAAAAAECAAAQGFFWEYHDRLFASREPLTDALLDSIAADLGLDIEKFRACREADLARGVVKASQRDAVRSGLDGAPAVFLDGRRLGGLPTYEQLAASIRERMATVRARSTPPPNAAGPAQPSAPARPEVAR